MVLVGKAGHFERGKLVLKYIIEIKWNRICGCKVITSPVILLRNEKNKIKRLRLK